MAGKGFHFTDDYVRRVVALLATDMTIAEIGERMSCSRTSIVTINRKFQVRAYAGRRSTWEPAEVRSFLQNQS
jgi:hypothetical protein